MKAAPWALVGVLAVLLVLARCSGAPENVRRAEAAEAEVARLEPIVDSLLAVAARVDTVVVVKLDSIRVVVERVRIVQVATADTLRASLDSAQAVLLDELVAAHAEEVAALEEGTRQALLWGTAWQEAAEALQAEREPLRLRGDQWEAAYRSQARRTWLERSAVVAAVAAVLILK